MKRWGVGRKKVVVLETYNVLKPCTVLPNTKPLITALKAVPAELSSTRKKTSMVKSGENGLEFYSKWLLLAKLLVKQWFAILLSWKGSGLCSHLLWTTGDVDQCQHWAHIFSVSLVLLIAESNCSLLLTDCLICLIYGWNRKPGFHQHHDTQFSLSTKKSKSFAPPFSVSERFLHNLYAH